MTKADFTLLCRALFIGAMLMLSACDRRPTLRVVASPSAPSPPTDAAFSTLPSRNEMLETMNSVYQYLDAEITLVGPLSGDVHWVPIAKGESGHPGFWTYHPKSRVIASAATAVFPEAEQLRLDAFRWRFREGSWELDALFSDYVTKHRGIEDPKDAQVVALLEQPGIKYAFHNFATVPRKIRVLKPARATRDADGFALMRYPVEFAAETDIIDFPNQSLHRHEVTVRALIYCDVRDGKWRAEEEVVLVGSKRLSSRPANDEELFKYHWAMDGWWRNH